jgi:hypothetical protein
MLWTAEGGNPVSFSTENTLADYSAVTGYDPDNPYSDQGANVRDVLKYRKSTGLLDATGKRHKIGAFVSLEPGNWQHLLEALYLFGAVGIGIQCPDSAMDQFNEGKPWSVVPGASIEGGHYIPLVAERGNLVCVTWAKLQQLTRRFFKKYCDEVWAILSEEMLNGGKSLEGFDFTQLQVDLQAL